MQRRARRSAQCAAKKTVPAKNSEANFWRPRFTWPLRAGKRANANFACSEGFFVRRAAPYSRLAVLARPAAFAPACVIGVPACVPCCTWRPGGRLAAIVSAFCGVVFRPTRRLPLLCLACAAPGACCRLSAVRRRHRFFCCFFMRSPRKALPFSAGVPLLGSRPACRFSAAFTQTLLCLFVWPALPARRALCARSSVLFWLSVCLFRVGCTRVFLLSLIFCPFLPNFFLSNFFSLVAQAATGLYFLPKRK